MQCPDLTRHRGASYAGKKKPFEIPVAQIISVAARKGLGNGVDHLFVTYQENGREQKVKIEHLAFWSGVAMGNLSQLKEPYFRSWEQSIEDTRAGKNTLQSDFGDLEKLAELKGKGIISEEEFAAKKKQLLGL